MEEEENINPFPITELFKNIDPFYIHYPLGLDIENEKVQKTALYLLPFSTGFEIETCMQDGKEFSVFSGIPYLIEYPCEKDELKFRIPNGIKGLYCLYHISAALKQHSFLNPKSGIHYHIDLSFFSNNNVIISSDVYNVLYNHSDFILEELSSWGYKGLYNKKAIGAGGVWCRYNSLGTVEFRIGEMTFDYSLLFKRIVHCNQIVKIVFDQEELLIKDTDLSEDITIIQNKLKKI